MFSSIRKALGSFGVMLLLGLLIASFAVWGIGDIFTGASQTTVASVGETRIDAQAFFARYQREIQQRERQTQQAIDREEARAQGVPQQILNQMVDEAAIGEVARRLGLRVANTQISETVREIDAFNGFDGRFDRAIFEQVLGANGYTVQDFFDVVERDLTRQQLLNALLASAETPKPLVDTLYRIQFETRVAEVVTIPQSAISLEETPSEEALAGYYEANRILYQSPAYRGVTALFLDPAVLGDSEEVTDADIEAAYAARLNEYVQPERRRLSLLSFDAGARASAQAASARITEGATLEAMAVELTDFTAEELSIGELTSTSLETNYSPAIAEAVFALEQGQVSEPLQSAFGWHLFRVDEIMPGQERSIKEVREELRTDIAARAAADKVYDLSRDAEERMLDGVPLEEIAEALDLPLSQADAIAQNGLGPDGRLVRTTPSLIPVLSDAFRLDPSSEPELIDYADGGFAFVRVDQLVEPTVPPFEDVRDRVEQDYLEEERRRLAGLRSEEALERIRAGEDMQSIAQEMGGTFLVTNAISRTGSGANEISPTITRFLFELDKDVADITTAATGDGYVIVRPITITPGMPDQDSPQYQSLVAQLNAGLNIEASIMLSQAIRDQVPVRINNGTLNRVLDGVR